MRIDHGDVLVLGTGPAGLALAAACAEQGLDVVCASPDPDARWHNGYAAWLDELAVAGADDCVEATWPAALVHTAARTHRLDRPYARIDNDALQDGLRERAERAGARFLSGTAGHVSHDGHGSEVVLADGDTLSAHLVVDATGHGAVLRAATPPTAFQVAWGRVVEVDDAPWSAEVAVLMDLRDANPGDADPPSFLYVLPLPGGRFLLEETSLAAATPVVLERLRRRLDARLDRLGVRVTAEHRVERCRIPLDVAPPRPGARVLAFGGSAGMVHPATGYQVARALAAAPRVARAISAHLSEGPEVTAARAGAAVWPASERRTRALHDLGLRLLLSLDAAETRDFFERFFALPPRHWRAYLSASAGPLAVASAMTSLFLRLGPARRRVTTVALGAGWPAMRDLVADLGGLR